MLPYIVKNTVLHLAAVFCLVITITLNPPLFAKILFITASFLFDAQVHYANIQLMKKL